jgi:hypothetical protein
MASVHSDDDRAVNAVAPYSLEMDDDASYISLFAQEQRRRGLSDGTIRVRTGHLKVIKAALGSFDAVTRPKLNRWFAERGYIDSTKRGYVDTLSEFFKYGM